MAVARACGSGSGNQKRFDPIRSGIVERSMRLTQLARLAYLVASALKFESA
jgi:hypothetical protein